MPTLTKAVGLIVAGYALFCVYCACEVVKIIIGG